MFRKFIVNTKIIVKWMMGQSYDFHWNQFHANSVETIKHFGVRLTEISSERLIWVVLLIDGVTPWSPTP